MLVAKVNPITFTPPYLMKTKLMAVMVELSAGLQLEVKSCTPTSLKTQPITVVDYTLQDRPVKVRFHTYYLRKTPLNSMVGQWNQTLQEWH